MNCKYARDCYGVPAEIGRRVAVNGEPGIIAADRGNYIGVNFDKNKPGVISNCHPTWEVEYQGISEVRSLTRSQQRYRRYLDYGDGFDSFIEYCRWDADPEREWNGGMDHEYQINRTFCSSSGCY